MITMKKIKKSSNMNLEKQKKSKSLLKEEMLRKCLTNMIKNFELSLTFIANRSSKELVFDMRMRSKDLITEKLLDLPIKLI